MGLFGAIFESVGYIAGEFGDLCKGVSEDARQLGDELVHISDDNYVSPYAKKKEAEEKISKANRKMDRARERYDSHVNRVEKKLQENYSRKKELLGKLEAETNKSSFSNYSSFDYMDIGSVGFRNRTDFKIGEFLGIFGHDVMDQAANSYLEDARDYEVEAKRVCAKIESYDAKLSRIEAQIEVEERLMDTLENQIVSKSINNRVQAAQAIRNLLNMMICDKNGEIQQKYIQELERLKRFC